MHVDKKDAVVAMFLHLVRARVGYTAPFGFAALIVLGIAMVALAMPLPLSAAMPILFGPSLPLYWILQNHWTWHYGLKHHRELLADAIDRVENPQRERAAKFLEWPDELDTKKKRIVAICVLLLAIVMVAARLSTL